MLTVNVHTRPTTTTQDPNCDNRFVEWPLWTVSALWAPRPPPECITEQTCSPAAIPCRHVCCLAGSPSSVLPPCADPSYRRNTTATLIRPERFCTLLFRILCAVVHEILWCVLFFSFPLSCFSNLSSPFSSLPLLPCLMWHSHCLSQGKVPVNMDGEAVP